MKPDLWRGRISLSLLPCPSESGILCLRPTTGGTGAIDIALFGRSLMSLGRLLLEEGLDIELKADIREVIELLDGENTQIRLRRLRVQDKLLNGCSEFQMEADGEALGPGQLYRAGTSRGFHRSGQDGRRQRRFQDTTLGTSGVMPRRGLSMRMASCSPASYFNYLPHSRFVDS